MLSRIPQMLEIHPALMLAALVFAAWAIYDDLRQQWSDNERND